MKVLDLALFIILVLVAAGCGTETGNPIDPDNLLDSPLPGISSWENLLCSKIQSCFASIPESCEQSTRNNSNMGKAFDVSKFGFFTLMDIHRALKSGLLSSNRQNQVSCAYAIQNLSCESHVIKNAYSEKNPNDFSNVPHLLKASQLCQQVYFESEEML